jgi:hypothetical protein
MCSRLDEYTEDSFSISVRTEATGILCTVLKAYDLKCRGGVGVMGLEPRRQKKGHLAHYVVHQHLCPEM